MDQVLVIESDQGVLDSLMQILRADAYQANAFTDPQSAMETLRSGTTFKAIVLGHHLPFLNGIEWLNAFKADGELDHIPVLFLAAVDDDEVHAEAMSSGAFAYLTNPIHPPLLLSLVSAAIKQHEKLLAVKRSAQEKIQTLGFLQTGQYLCKTITDAGKLAYGLSHMCPDHERIRVVFHELLINAVEHGNLEIGYAEKTRLLLEDGLHEEVERRLADPVYGQRLAKVEFSRTADSLVFTIQDEGAGFDWQQYLEFSPERAMDPNGRGIALSIMSTQDAVEYFGNGSTVRVTVSL